MADFIAQNIQIYSQTSESEPVLDSSFLEEELRKRYPLPKPKFKGVIEVDSVKPQRNYWNQQGCLYSVPKKKKQNYDSIEVNFNSDYDDHPRNTSTPVTHSPPLTRSISTNSSSSSIWSHSSDFKKKTMNVVQIGDFSAHLVHHSAYTPELSIRTRSTRSSQRKPYSTPSQNYISFKYIGESNNQFGVFTAKINNECPNYLKSQAVATLPQMMENNSEKLTSTHKTNKISKSESSKSEISKPRTTKPKTTKSKKKKDSSSNIYHSLFLRSIHQPAPQKQPREIQYNNDIEWATQTEIDDTETYLEADGQLIPLKSSSLYSH